jgi:hypothetical protein
MNKVAEGTDRERPARCRVCGKEFNAEEMAAARVEDSSSGACIVSCTGCSAENELVVQPSAGLGHQPEVVVSSAETTRTAEKK